jgi:hypothetical protein
VLCGIVLSLSDSSRIVLGVCDGRRLIVRDAGSMVEGYQQVVYCCELEMDGLDILSSSTELCHPTATFRKVPETEIPARAVDVTKGLNHVGELFDETGCLSGCLLDLCS